MSQLQPTIEPELVPLSVAASGKRSRFKLPGWLSLLLANPKSRFGLTLIGFIVLVAIIAPTTRRTSTSSRRGRRRRGTTSSARPTRAATSSPRSCSAHGAR
jgi:hypothetical protein